MGLGPQQQYPLVFLPEQCQCGDEWIDHHDSHGRIHRQSSSSSLTTNEQEDFRDSSQEQEQEYKPQEKEPETNSARDAGVEGIDLGLAARRIGPFHLAATRSTTTTTMDGRIFFVLLVSIVIVLVVDREQFRVRTGGLALGGDTLGYLLH